MKHVSEKKKKELQYIKELLTQYDVIGIADLTNLPSPQLQKLKKKLENKLKIKITKKRLISLAIDEIKNKNLSGLKPYLNKSIPALVLSNEDPFKLYKLIKENKSTTTAKPGQISPKDLTIEPGPTNFPPGPVIGEIGAIGLKTAVESGKIVIKQGKTVVKQNEIIKPEVAAILAKLGFEPIEISLNLLGFYYNNLVYDKSTLDIDEESYLQNIKLAYAQALKLAEHIQYISKDNIKQLLQKAYLQAKSLSLKENITVDETYKETKVEKIKEQPQEEIKEIKQEEKLEKEELEEKEEKKEVKKEDFVGYREETVKKAQEILTKLQDEKIKEQEKPKHKSMWD
ncbi:MAG: 50S ribosomal protein L10 [Nanoarchaeota archaeon]